VADTGIGIPQAEQMRIFERFLPRGCCPVARGRRHGLGLSIARHIVEAHGGRIWVRTAPWERVRVSISACRSCPDRRFFHNSHRQLLALSTLNAAHT